MLLLITPLPGALAKQPFHIQRTLTLLLPISLLLTIGYDKLISISKNKIVIPSVFALASFSLLFFWRSYFVLLPQQRSDIWGFEWKQISEFIKDHPNDHFIIDQSDRIKPQEMAYPQLAFYLKLDPTLLQSDQKKNIVKNYYTDIEFSTFHKFLNIEMRPIDWGEAANTNEILIGDTASISDREVRLHNLKEVIEIKDPNNNIILRGFKTSPNKVNNSK